MNITKESNKLISFFIKYNCILPIKQTNKTNDILQNIYKEIKNGVSYVHHLKTTIGEDAFYNLKIEHITNLHQIPKPNTFLKTAFPPEIIKHIDKYSIGLLNYTCHIFDRNIHILFLTEDGNINKLIKTYNHYVDTMLVWLYMANIYSSKDKKCATQLKIFIYHTSHLKLFPYSNNETLDTIHVNTAFTRTCPVNSEIIVFRKEEWFKVFIHETIHNFGLDFSDMDLDICNQYILNIFPVNSDINLYESYTECWARIMNALFCSFINMKNKNVVADFLTNAEFFINVERIFAFFQMVKVLDFMNLSYVDLYKKTNLAENNRRKHYKENTSVLSYYVITSLLINNYSDFLLWCNINNTSLLNFKKTNAQLEHFCKFIDKKYKTKNMLEGIECTEHLLHRLKKNKNMLYLLKNLRMTICELG